MFIAKKLQKNLSNTFIYFHHESVKGIDHFTDFVDSFFMNFEICSLIIKKKEILKL